MSRANRPIVVRLEALAPADLAALAKADPTLDRWLRGWFASLPAARPLCMTCDHCFTSSHPPALWLRIVADGETLSGVCGACVERHGSDLMLAVRDVLREHSPDLRIADPANLHRRGGRA